QHRELFAQYWRRSDDWVQHALQTGIMRTAFSWHCRTGITEFNERSIRNWPIQATGADILRIACILATRHGIRLLAPIHDAVLIEAPIEKIEADVTLMREIMRRASRIVLDADAAGSHELRTDCTIIRHPDSYSDKRNLGGSRCPAKPMPPRSVGSKRSGMTDDYAKRRLAELHAAAPTKR